MRALVVGYVHNTRLNGDIDEKYVYKRISFKDGCTKDVFFFKTDKGNKRKVRPDAIHTFPPAVLKKINEEMFPASINEEMFPASTSKEAWSGAENTAPASDTERPEIVKQKRRCKNTPCIDCKEGLCYELWKSRRFNHEENSLKDLAERNGRHRRRLAKKEKSTRGVIKRSSSLFAESQLMPFHQPSAVKKLAMPIRDGELEALQHYHKNEIGVRNIYTYEYQRLAAVMKNSPIRTKAKATYTHTLSKDKSQRKYKQKMQDRIKQLQQERLQAGFGEGGGDGPCRYCFGLEIRCPYCY